MKLIYERPLVDEIAELLRQARDRGRRVKAIELTEEELRQVRQEVCVEFFVGPGLPHKTMVLGIPVEVAK